MYQFKTTPFKHQRQALEIGWDRRYFAYLMEMGTGKSKVAIDNFFILLERGRVDSLLIIAPKGNYEDWLDLHLPTHAPGTYASYLWKGQTTQKERGAFEGFLSTTRNPKIMIINVEALSASAKRGEQACRNFLQQMTSPMIVLDESTTVRSHSAKRSKSAISLSRMASYIRILTGAPITKSPLDAYMQFEFLSPMSLGFRNFYSFRARYAVLQSIPSNGRYISIPVGFRNLEELNQKVMKHSYRVLKKDCLDLPPKVYQLRKYEMSDEQARIYADLRECCVSELGDGTYISASSAVSVFTRLHQIATGYGVSEAGVSVELGSAGITALLETIRESSGRTVIWAAFKRNIESISKALAKEYPYDGISEYHGDIPHDERRANLRAFQAGDNRFFLGTTATGGRGIDLSCAKLGIYFSNAPDLELREQSEDRLHRIGQVGDSVTYVDLVAEGTIAFGLLKRLRAKQRISAEVLGELVREWVIS